MNTFNIKITLKNGITDTTTCPMEYKNVEDFYEELKSIRMNNKYLKFKIDDYIVEYNFEDISLIKIYQIKEME